MGEEGAGEYYGSPSGSLRIRDLLSLHKAHITEHERKRQKAEEAKRHKQTQADPQDVAWVIRANEHAEWNQREQQRYSRGYAREHKASVGNHRQSKYQDSLGGSDGEVTGMPRDQKHHTRDNNGQKLTSPS